MRIGLFTLLDDNFVTGYVAFMKSLLHYNPWFEHDLVILDVGLSNVGKDFVAKHYERVRFVKPNKRRYSDVDMSKTVDKLKATYYTLDAFIQTDFDRIVQFDMDMVVLGDISAVFECGAPIAACRAYNSKHDFLGDGCNAGLFVVNKPYLNEKTYADLLAIARRGHSMPEQKTMNIHFDGKWHWLPKIYNVEKRMMTTKKYKEVLENARVLHFVAEKPWQNKTNAREASYEPLEKLWWKEYER